MQIAAKILNQAYSSYTRGMSFGHGLSSLLTLSDHPNTKLVVHLSKWGPEMNVKRTRFPSVISGAYKINEVYTFYRDFRQPVRCKNLAIPLLDNILCSLM